MDHPCGICFLGLAFDKIQAMKESKPFYHTAAWKRIRSVALMRDNGMCRDCMELFDAGIIRHPNPATTVHHIQHLEDRPDLALDLNNLVSLCEACHNKRHPEKGGGDDAPPVSSRMRVIKV